MTADKELRKRELKNELTALLTGIIVIVAEARGYLIELSNNSIGDDARLELETHLQSCVACSREHEELKVTFRRLEKWEIPEPSEDFFGAVKRDLIEKTAFPVVSTEFSTDWRLLVAILCLSVAAASLPGLGETGRSWLSQFAKPWDVPLTALLGYSACGVALALLLISLPTFLSNFTTARDGS